MFEFVYKHLYLVSINIMQLQNAQFNKSGLLCARKYEHVINRSARFCKQINLFKASRLAPPHTMLQ